MRAGAEGACEDCGRPGIIGDSLSLSGRIPPFRLRCRECRAAIRDGRPEHPDTPDDRLEVLADHLRALARTPAHYHGVTPRRRLSAEEIKELVDRIWREQEEER